jgi:hypothetical protein
MNPTDQSDQYDRCHLRSSLRWFLVVVGLLGLGLLALLVSFATWQPSAWTIGSPGDAIWITAVCVLGAIPCALTSIVRGLPLARRRPLVLLWTGPLALLLGLALLGLVAGLRG